MKVSKSFKAVRPGEIYPSVISQGEEVEGRLAEIAVALNAVETPAKTLAKASKAAKGAPENKAD